MNFSGRLGGEQQGRVGGMGRQVQHLSLISISVESSSMPFLKFFSYF